MDKDILISVIVPVFNVERYLDECIESVLRQTYTNLELILVNDGSTDGSGSIIDKWQKKDARVVAIHKENAGVSCARNAGIKAAQGEYIFFVDSDDYIADNCIEVLFQRIVETGADIASCRYYSFWVNGGHKETKLPCEKVIIKREVYLEHIYLYVAYMLVWNKLYRRNLFDNVLFTEGRINEDAIIMPRLISQANKIAHSPEVLYYYRQRNGSIMHGDKKEHTALGEVQWVKEDIERYKQSGEIHLCRMAQKLCFNKMLGHYMFMGKGVKRKFKKELLALSKEMVGYQRFGAKVRLKIFVAARFANTYSRYYNKKFSPKTEYKVFE